MHQDPSRVRWAGRRSEEASGLDGWNADRDRLTGLLDEAAELIVLDAPSFPWPVLTAARRTLPLTVVLPADLDAATVMALLTEPLRGRLTPADCLVEPRPDVRRVVEAHWEVDPGTWVEAGSTRSVTELAGARQRKALLVEAERRLTGALATGLADAPPDPVVAVRGLGGLRFALDAAAGLATVPLDEAGAGDADAVAVLLPDGGQDPAERLAGLSAAYAAVRPGGALVVLGHVVTAPGAAANPRLSTLVGELQAASGLGLQLEDIASVRWPEEQLARGVLLRYTSLAPPRPTGQAS